MFIGSTNAQPDIQHPAHPPADRKPKQRATPNGNEPCLIRHRCPPVRSGVPVLER